MCKVFYSECHSCPDRFRRCRYYDKQVQWCRSYLAADVPFHLVIEKADEYGNLDYMDNGIKFMTKPEDWNELFRKIHCNYQQLEVSKSMPVIDCPYHKSDGLKKNWDTEGKDKYDAKQQKMIRRKQKAAKRKERKNHDRENGCIIL